MSEKQKEIRERTILEEYVLDKTDLDEKVLETLDDVETFLTERKSNVKFVWNKFRKTAYVFISIGFVAGVLFGGAFL